MANGKEEAEIIRKGNKNFSGQGGEEGGGEGQTDDDVQLYIPQPM